MAEASCHSQKFLACASKLVGEDGELILPIPTALYIESFQIIIDFLGELGSVFGFVTSDIEAKLNALTAYSGDNDAYSTMQGTIEYEVENKITVIKKKPYSGTRAINRLTRALIFIVKLLEDLIVAPDDASAGKVASEAYAATLKKHHPWLVQKTVGAAMYTLPNRDKLIVKLCGEAKNQDDLDAVGKTGAILTKLNNANTEFLGKHDLLDIK